MLVMNMLYQFNTNSLQPSRSSGRSARCYGYLILCLSLIHYPAVTIAEWVVNPNTINESAGTTTVAHNANDQGYTLEVYKDADQAIRVRFSLYEGLLRLQQGHCPTYQIDRDPPANRSYNGDSCITTDASAEYLFGTIQGRQITSAPMFGIMNGNNITFRFKLENGDYRETQISLAGSKRSLTSVVGQNINVVPR